MLNFIKKYIWLSACLAVAFLLLAGVSVRLFFVYKNHVKELRELDEASGRLDQLYNRPTFPSAANVIREKERLKDLVDEYNELHGLLATGQVQPQEMEGAEFMNFLEKTLLRMRERLQVGKVVFPEKYAFGFEDYSGLGKMPLPEAIPRLVQQLKIAEIICNLLPDAAVTELLAFTREDFEKQAAFTERLQPGGRAKKPVPPPAPAGGPAGAESYTTQHFKISFRAREGSLLDLLNRLARLPMCTAVTRLEIVNPRAESSISGAGAAPAPADKSKAATNAPAEEISRDKRIILGREDVEVKLEMDVYNFGPPMEFREGAPKKNR